MARNGKRRARNNGRGGNGTERSVIMLRIPVRLKQRLFDHCQRRSAREGRRVSYNEALIEFARAGLR